MFIRKEVIIIVKALEEMIDETMQKTTAWSDLNMLSKYHVKELNMFKFKWLSP